MKQGLTCDIVVVLDRSGYDRRRVQTRHGGRVQHVSSPNNASCLAKARVDAVKFRRQLRNRLRRHGVGRRPHPGLGPTREHSA